MELRKEVRQAVRTTLHASNRTIPAVAVAAAAAVDMKSSIAGRFSLRHTIDAMSSDADVATSHRGVASMVRDF